MKIGIGIDTGGTCTDAVAYDFDTKTLLAKGKALTTRENLSIGIGGALDMLPQELIRGALLVSLSTTLATNACLEGKGGRAKLLIFGMTDELAARFDAPSEYGFKSEDVRCVDTHGSADGLRAGGPDWDAVAAEHGAWLADSDALAAAELYSVYNAAPCEKRFKKLAAELFGALPCVCASELTSALNVFVRGATALLNARMLPVVREFVEAALSDFAARGCRAPVMVVRSDGSLMSSEFSRSRPVETILSGPAASVLAGKRFCGKRDCVIVDMGGTTTDISVIRAGRPVTAEDGIRLGGWRTSVKGVFVAPFALGGDSAVRLKNGAPGLFPRRVTPVCVAASRRPEMKDALRGLLKSGHVNQFPLHEFFCLVREPSGRLSYDADELALIRALEKGPCMLENLREAAGIDLYHFDGGRLEEEGVIMRCGLTPTDFMHIKGDYTEFDTAASELAARYLLLALKREDTPDAVRELAGEVYGAVEGGLYENILRVMLAQKYPKQFKNGADAQTEFLIREAWASRGAGGDALFRYSFGTDAALVGIGAPAHVFLPEAARALGAECVLPEHAEVANALGALSADINVTARVEISQRLGSSGGMYYIVHSPAGSAGFDSRDEAAAAAMAAAEEAALKEARLRGASGELRANTYIESHSTVSRWGTDVALGGAAVSEVAVSLEPHTGTPVR
ncbi:MAG: hydantoinase/oxoprolinase family protein [Oscillospiraceae bacterium]|jgi:N-methylhydantoinase A/oxoprolinase/acetone carboxylase beta subunit|nr:hydantoinase/oxoprolinase family protein [Oscillospiraceae bacterium]